MSDVVAEVVTGALPFVGLVGGMLGVYYKLKSSFTDQIKDEVMKQVGPLQGKMELRLQALELDHMSLKEVVVRKEDMADVKAEIRSLGTRIDDLRGMLKNALRRQ